MTTNSPSASERHDDVSDRSEQQTLARTVGARLAMLDPAWIVAAVAGGALLVRGLRTARDRRGRGLLQVVAGAGLLAVGYTRRGAADRRRGEGADEASADAHVELERPDTDSNPRDVSDDPEAAPSSEDEGDIQFSDDQTDDLDDASDPDGTEGLDASDRGETAEDDAVEVDISEAAMADEPGEAAGPSSEQAAPTTTKTDLSPPSDVEDPDVEEDLETGSDGDGDGVGDGDGAGDDGTVEMAGGAEVHTDSNESGTMDVDEEDVTDESGEPLDDHGVEELSDDEAADYQAPDGEEGSEETEETEGGAEVHTDTNESGTMDVDEEDYEGRDVDGEDAAGHDAGSGVGDEADKDGEAAEDEN